MAEKLTPQQLEAVTNRGGKLLVSAAAGSGKTKVLVDRLLGYLTDPKDPADLDSFLIITYTKAAASELRAKIAAKLTEKIAKCPENRHLQQQIQRLYLTKISTVHAFCSDILREYAYRLNIPADFRVGDEIECQQMQMRAMEHVLERAYEEIDQNEDFQAFADTLGLGRDDRLIPPILLKVYHSAKCHIDPDQWLTWCCDSLSFNEQADASQTVWGMYLIEDLWHYIDLNIAALQRCIKRAEESEGMEKPAALLTSTVSQLTYLRQSSTWDEICARKNLDFGRLTFSKKATDCVLAEQIKAIRNSCKNGLEKKLKAFSNGNEHVMKDLQGAASAVRGLIALVKQFEAEYDRLKKNRRILDFADLEHYTLDLLLGRHRTGVTVTAFEIGKRFREIMVDEYQDSNQVQDAIFSALTKERNNCFMVGDVKQSIYQFRLADPGIFIEKYNTYVSPEAASVGVGRKILLSSNFRSATDVISAVNDVFTSCMSERVGGLKYGEDELLREGLPHVPLNECGVELYGIQVQSDTYAEEAAFVAERISQLLDGTHCVRDGDNLRPITPDDIVILLRSPGSVGGEFLYALEQAGIRCATEGTFDLLQTEEVSTLWSLLQIIQNPLQDIPLTAVLLSRVFGFTADDLAQLRGTDRRSSIYCLLQTWERGADFCRILTKLRKESRMVHLSQLIQRIFLLTQMDSIYAAMPNGKERGENLQAFFRMAAEFEVGGRGSLGDFLEHLNTMQQQGVRSSVDRKQSGSVSIMSIHKSKGLEFPVVFLCGLSRGFNQESARETVLCDRDLGIGLSCADQRLRIRYPSMAKRAIGAKMMSESISEEMRVLYVAMTRARDRLIMTYASNNLQSEVQDLTARMDLSDPELLTGQVSCPGSWVLQTALKRTEAGELFALGGQPADVAYKEPSWLIRVVEGDNALNTKAVEQQSQDALENDAIIKIKEDLYFTYAYTEATKTPSKQTATQLKGRIKDQEAAENTKHISARKFRKPAFVQSSHSGAEYGTAMHAVMQYIDYAACKDLRGIKEELERLVQQKLITDTQASMISREQIAALFATELGKKLQNSSNVLREFKFSILDDCGDYNSKMEGEQVLLQGVVDCALMDEDGITVIDFKTDYVTEETEHQMLQQYQPQVAAYAMALERIYRKPVKAAFLYFFRLNKFIPVNM